MRIRNRFFKRMPSRSLLITTIDVTVITLALPFIPLDTILGLSQLPKIIMLMIFGITLTYMIVTELSKKI